MGAANWPDVGPSAKVAAGIWAHPVSTCAWAAPVHNSKAVNEVMAFDKGVMRRIVSPLLVIDAKEALDTYTSR